MYNNSSTLKVIYGCNLLFYDYVILGKSIWSLDTNDSYIFTGGGDGAIRKWPLENDHTKTLHGRNKSRLLSAGADFIGRLHASNYKLYRKYSINPLVQKTSLLEVILT